MRSNGFEQHRRGGGAHEGAGESGGPAKAARQVGDDEKGDGRFRKRPHVDVPRRRDVAGLGGDCGKGLGDLDEIDALADHDHQQGKHPEPDQDAGYGAPGPPHRDGTLPPHGKPGEEEGDRGEPDRQQHRVGPDIGCPGGRRWGWRGHGIESGHPHLSLVERECGRLCCPRARRVAVGDERGHPRQTATLLPPRGARRGTCAGFLRIRRPDRSPPPRRRRPGRTSCRP